MSSSSLATPELSSAQDAGISSLSQTELEKQRQVSGYPTAGPTVLIPSPAPRSIGVDWTDLSVFLDSASDYGNC